MAGSKIYSGSTSPSASLGFNGDYYFDTSSSDFYGPKTAAGWGNPVNLRGATGTTGAPGQKGDPGPAGTNGNNIIAASGSPTGEGVEEFDSVDGSLMEYNIGKDDAKNYGIRAVYKDATKSVLVRLQ